MLSKVRYWQHGLVLVVILAVSALAGTRVIGAGDNARFRPESFDAKQVTVWPEGADGVRVREVVDIDFGAEERHGYQRIIPNDFGVPTDVTASSPDASDDVSVTQTGSKTRILIGDPDVTLNGRRRYVVEYTLPDAGLASGQLWLDIIGNDETFETARFEVVLTGFEFSETVCHTGRYRAVGGCSLDVTEDGNYVTVIEPLDPYSGITVGGDVSSLSSPLLPLEPARPSAIPSGFQPLGFLLLPIGLFAAVIVFVGGRRYGSNEVLAGGAADAAFGDLPVPGMGNPLADLPTYRVPDSRLAELATIEFAPPRGIEPWHGTVLLREQVDDDSVSAWLSEMVAHDALVISEGEDGTHLERGADTARLSGTDQDHLRRLFAAGDSVELGTYDESFNKTWQAIKSEQTRFAEDSGWWSRGGPSERLAVTSRVIGSVILISLVMVPLSFLMGSSPRLAQAIIASPWFAIALGFAAPLLAAFVAYSGMYPARTATGSALTLRTESFRRFLAASEGKHVDWAWENGLVREYSAWAVALGAAEVWSEAIESSNVSDPELALAGPLLVYTASSAFQSAHTAPSSSSGGGGGGGVGGGGGGGSSGSW